jgi:hypothetical protein
MHGLDALCQVLNMLLRNAFDNGTGTRSVVLQAHAFSDLDCIFQSIVDGVSG